MNEKDFKDIEKALNKLNKEELKELARVTLISRKKALIRNNKMRAKKKEVQ